MLLSISFAFADDYSRFPFFSPKLVKIGLLTPDEQYCLYGSVLLFLSASRKPFMQAYWLNKYLHATDESMKDICAGRGNFSEAELRAGEKLLKELRKTPRRWAAVPVAFLIVESAIIAKRSFSKWKDNTDCK